ncbi:MAG TPA: hypothetical protein VIL48_20225 [Acidimicrobiales bacterium]
MWGRVLTAAAGAALVVSVAGCADEADPEDALSGPVVLEDHWHAAFGVYVCDRFLPNPPDFDSPHGIHTHGDGVIHIHPFTSDGAGDNATLGLFLEGAGIEVSDDELVVDDETYRAGDDACGGEEAEVVVLQWADVYADAEPERVDPSARFRQDGEGYVVAFVPAGTEVPVPESAADLEALGRLDSRELYIPTTSRRPGGDGQDGGVGEGGGLGEGGGPPPAPTPAR